MKYGIVQDYVSNVEFSASDSIPYHGKRIISYKPKIALIDTNLESGREVATRKKLNEDSEFIYWQNKNGTINFGIKDTNTPTKFGGLWSSNNKDFESITGLRIYTDIKCPGTSIMFNILLDDLLTLLPTEYSCIETVNGLKVVKTADIDSEDTLLPDSSKYITTLVTAKYVIAPIPVSNKGSVRKVPLFLKKQELEYSKTDKENKAAMDLYYDAFINTMNVGYQLPESLCIGYNTNKGFISNADSNTLKFISTGNRVYSTAIIDKVKVPTINIMQKTDKISKIEFKGEFGLKTYRGNIIYPPIEVDCYVPELNPKFKYMIK